MEYSRKVDMPDGTNSIPSDLEFWILVVFLQSPPQTGHSDLSSLPSAGLPEGTNVAVLMVAGGFATENRHVDFEERSNYYDALLAAEAHAASGKKGLHSKKYIPAMHIRDLTMVEVETVGPTRTFLGSLWESKTNVAVSILEAGLAKLQHSFGSDKIADAHLLAKAQGMAKHSSD